MSDQWPVIGPTNELNELLTISYDDVDYPHKAFNIELITNGEVRMACVQCGSRRYFKQENLLGRVPVKYVTGNWASTVSAPPKRETKCDGTDSNRN